MLYIRDRENSCFFEKRRPLRNLFQWLYFAATVTATLLLPCWERKFEIFRGPKLFWFWTYLFRLTNKSTSAFWKSFLKFHVSLFEAKYLRWWNYSCLNYLQAMERLNENGCALLVAYGEREDLWIFGKKARIHFRRTYVR